MHRIKHSTADKSDPSKPRFTEGNPATGVPATVVTADWLNDVQENIVRVIKDADIDLTQDRDEDLKDAIAGMISAHVPEKTLAGMEAHVFRRVDGNLIWEHVTDTGTLEVGPGDEWCLLPADTVARINDEGELEVTLP